MIVIKLIESSWQGMLSFFVGGKSFEIRGNGDNWYGIIERRRNFVNRLTVDRINLLEVCKYLKLASIGKGNIVRK